MTLVAALPPVDRSARNIGPKATVRLFVDRKLDFPKAVELAAGDMVFYRMDGRTAPAVLVQPAGGGCWLARDARGLLYLGAESISLRLAPVDADLLAEAA